MHHDGPEKLGPRAAHRQKTLGRIKMLALRQLADEGAGALSLRAIARDLGLVSSAMYRYFASRDELVTALIVDAYGDLAQALQEEPSKGREGFEARCHRMRAWALDAPHRFTLIYGSAIPGYVAPPETIEPALEVARALAAPFAGNRSPAYSSRIHDDQAQRLADAFSSSDGEVDPAGAVVALSAAAKIIGAITLELGGHFVGIFEPADGFFAEVVAGEAEVLSAG